MPVTFGPKVTGTQGSKVTGTFNAKVTGTFRPKVTGTHKNTRGLSLLSQRRTKKARKSKADERKVLFRRKR